eukprot:14046803-Alexandrium_andersonii.AAC.1
MRPSVASGPCSSSSEQLKRCFSFRRRCVATPAGSPDLRRQMLESVQVSRCQRAAPNCQEQTAIIPFASLIQADL